MKSASLVQKDVMTFSQGKSWYGGYGTLVSLTATVALMSLFASAQAATLEVDPDAPAWAHLGADALLYSHIAGGAIGLLTGVIAVLSRKGALVHRSAGKLFLVAMFVAYLIGAGVAPFLHEGQRPNFVAGILALYLLISGWRTVRKPVIEAGSGAIIGLIIASSITALGFYFRHLGAKSPTGTIDGSPPQAFILFAALGSFAATGDLHLVLRRRLSGSARLARHLWRMCASFFIAAGSLFLGQPQVFPDWFNASPAPFLFAFAPLLAMGIWLVLVRFGYPRPKRP